MWIASARRSLERGPRRPVGSGPAVVATGRRRAACGTRTVIYCPGAEGPRRRLPPGPGLIITQCASSYGTGARRPQAPHHDGRSSSSSESSSCLTVTAAGNETPDAAGLQVGSSSGPAILPISNQVDHLVSAAAGESLVPGMWPPGPGTEAAAENETPARARLRIGPASRSLDLRRQPLRASREARGHRHGDGVSGPGRWEMARSQCHRAAERDIISDRRPAWLRLGLGSASARLGSAARGPRTRETGTRRPATGSRGLRHPGSALGPPAAEPWQPGPPAMPRAHGPAGHWPLAGERSALRLPRSGQDRGPDSRLTVTARRRAEPLTGVTATPSRRYPAR